MNVIRISEGEGWENRMETISENLMAENFPKLIKNQITDANIDTNLRKEG